MKILFILLLITTSLYSQWNFSFENNKVTWQKIFEPKDSLNYKDYFKENALTKNLDFSRNKTNSFSDNFLIKNVSNFKTTIEGFNIKGGFFANVTIEFKNNKYRVTIKDIKIQSFKVYKEQTYYPYNNNNYLSIESIVFNTKGNLKNTPIFKDLFLGLEKYFDESLTLNYNITKEFNW